MRAVSSGTDGSGCDGSNMGGLQGGKPIKRHRWLNASDFANRVWSFLKVGLAMALVGF